MKSNESKTNYVGMRRFRLDRLEDPTGVSGTGCVAQGLVFSDGTTVVRWLGDHPTTTIHPDIESVEHIHLHGGKTKIRWEDSICFACGSLALDVGWCSDCGATWTGDGSRETRPDATQGQWVKTATIGGE